MVLLTRFASFLYLITLSADFAVSSIQILRDYLIICLCYWVMVMATINQFIH